MVGVKDFEMPRFCCECPLTESTIIGEYYAICLARGEKISVNLDTGKDDRCPLVEVEEMQELKTGRWIEYVEPDDAEPLVLWRCENCDTVERRKTLYCPHCGTRMEVEE